MKRSIQPRVESLELKALLSGVAAAPALAAAVTTPTDHSALSVQLSVAQSGRFFDMTLTETNTSNQDVKVMQGNGVADFWVTQGGVEVWRKSTDGPQPQGAYSRTTLHPGQSRTFMAAWDGRFTEAKPPGTGAPFVFNASVDNVAASAPDPRFKPFGSTASAPPSGAAATTAPTVSTTNPPANGTTNGSTPGTTMVTNGSSTRFNLTHHGATPHGPRPRLHLRHHGAALGLHARHSA